MPPSPRPRTRPSTGILPALALGFAGLLLLSACSADGPVDPPVESPGETSAAPEPSGDPEPVEPVQPFAIDCEALLTLDDVYAFNPNYGSDPGYEAASVFASDAVAIEGTACGWVNQTSGATFEVLVATPTEARLEELKNRAALQAKPVPTYGTPPAVEGYFQSVGGVGTAQTFSGPYWLVVSSPDFFEPGDPQPLVAAALGHLPAS